MAGSENHLRAFARNLKIQTGETYVPRYQNQNAYDAIVRAAAAFKNTWPLRNCA
jgi:hypothetical protein